VVTGAPNLFPFLERPLERPLKVAFALEGATLYDGHQPGWVKMTLQGRAIRGIYSDAMVCSEKELGISEDHEGIILLDPEAPVGMPLADYMGDVVLDIDLTPNLAHAFSILGVAREVAALTGRRLRYPSTAVKALGPAVRRLVDDPDRRPGWWSAPAAAGPPSSSAAPDLANASARWMGLIGPWIPRIC